MNKKIMVATMMLLGSITALGSNNNRETEVKATITLIAPLNVSVQKPLIEFGEYVIGADSEATASNRVTIGGLAGKNVVVNIDDSFTLTRKGGSETIPVTVVGTNSGGSNVILDGGLISMGMGSAGEIINTDVNLTYTANLSNAKVEGTYEGIQTISVRYNG